MNFDSEPKPIDKENSGKLNKRLTLLNLMMRAFWKLRCGCCESKMQERCNVGDRFLGDSVDSIMVESITSTESSNDNSAG